MISHLLKNRNIFRLNSEKEFIKYIFYRNPMEFKITSFYIESINPNEKFMIYARKKGFNDYGFIRIAKIMR